MDNMEDKLNAILGNPQLMQQIIGMAQALQQPQSSSSQESASPTDIDISQGKQLAGLSRQGNISPEQQNLLQALGPYLSRDRIQKLEKAMRAAKMARFASAFLNSGGLQLISGR